MEPNRVEINSMLNERFFDKCFHIFQEIVKSPRPDWSAQDLIGMVDIDCFYGKGIHAKWLHFTIKFTSNCQQYPQHSHKSVDEKLMRN